MKQRVWIRRPVVRERFEPDLSFLPPQRRRRLSPLQKIVFSIARDAAGDERDYALFFSSREGEDRLTRALVRGFRESGEVSPLRFSASVYNAAPGLFSVFTGNRRPYGALAAGEETLECGLLEALLHPGRRLWVYAEERDGGFGCGCLLEDAPGGTPLLLAPGDAARPAPAFPDAKAFLEGRAPALAGRYLTLRAAGGAPWPA